MKPLEIHRKTHRNVVGNPGFFALSLAQNARNGARFCSRCSLLPLRNLPSRQTSPCASLPPQ